MATINIYESPPEPEYVYIQKKRMHWIYFLFIGCWLGFMAICCIIPLFIPGLVKKAFGYW